MSILVKGIEMPTSCRACHLKMNCDDCEGWECVCVPLQGEIGYLSDLPTDKRRVDCPLVPVQKHGRLIDADALINALQELFDRRNKDAEYTGFRGAFVSWNDAICYIKDAPTIIEAEEG